MKDTCEKYGAYTTRWGKLKKYPSVSTVFVFLDLAWSHVLSISYSLLSNGQCSFQPFKCHRRMEGNHNIWCFHLNMNWFPSQGESASKAETDFPNWLRPRGGDWWTALESHQKVSQDLFQNITIRKSRLSFPTFFFLIFIIADSLHETHICSQTPLPLMIIQLSGTTLELQLLLALQCWGLNNWTAVSAAWTMTVQLHFRRFTLFQQQKITFRSPSQTYNYSKTDKRIPSFYFSRLVLLPELFRDFF